MTDPKNNQTGIAGAPQDADYCQASQIIGVRVSRCVFHDRLDPYYANIYYPVGVRWTGRKYVKDPPFE